MGKSLLIYWFGLAFMALASSLLITANADADAAVDADINADIDAAAAAAAPECRSATPWEDCLCPKEQEYLEAKLRTEAKTAAERFNELVTDYGRRTPEETEAAFSTVVSFVSGAGGWDDRLEIWQYVEKVTYVGYNLVYYDVPSVEAREALMTRLEKLRYDVVLRTDSKWERGFENFTDHLDSAREVTPKASDLPNHFSCDAKDQPLACGHHYDVASSHTQDSWIWQEARAGIKHLRDYAKPAQVKDYLAKRGRYRRACFGPANTEI
jgi:hypothetical protein